MEHMHLNITNYNGNFQLAEMEETRDRKLSNIFTNLQAMCRGRMARNRMHRQSRRTEALKIIQRNSRIYVNLREWHWWRLYSRVRYK